MYSCILYTALKDNNANYENKTNLDDIGVRRKYAATTALASPYPERETGDCPGVSSRGRLGMGASG